MNYNIWLLNFITGNFEYSNHSKFIAEFGLNRFKYNMALKWGWNDLERQRQQGDGWCCYIELL